MVAAKRGAGMTDDRSGIVWALEHRLRGRHIWTPPHYEANPLWASQLPVLRYTDTVRHYSKRYKIPGEKINIRPKSSGSRRRASPLGIATHWYLCLYTPRYHLLPQKFSPGLELLSKLLARSRTAHRILQFVPWISKNADPSTPKKLWKTPGWAITGAEQQCLFTATPLVHWKEDIQHDHSLASKSRAILCTSSEFGHRYVTVASF